MATLLAIMHARAGRLDDAAQALTEVAQDLEPGQWNHLYLSLLAQLDQPLAFRRLRRKTRADVLNSIGLCLSRIGQQRKAIHVFVRLAEFARRHRLPSFLGYSLINLGVANYELGQIARARQFYERAITHARRTRDSQLLARATHNLGMIRLDDDPIAGEKLLLRSVQLKADRGDLRHPSADASLENGAVGVTGV
jgi:tetratricopeptide (TPR) repeat protein